VTTGFDPESNKVVAAESGIRSKAGRLRVTMSMLPPRTTLMGNVACVKKRTMRVPRVTTEKSALE
jgi:hypothetical protein